MESNRGTRTRASSSEHGTENKELYAFSLSLESASLVVVRKVDGMSTSCCLISRTVWAVGYFSCRRRGERVKF